MGEVFLGVAVKSAPFGFLQADVRGRQLAVDLRPTAAALKGIANNSGNGRFRGHHGSEFGPQPAACAVGRTVLKQTFVCKIGEGRTFGGVDIGVITSYLMAR